MALKYIPPRWLWRSPGLYTDQAVGIGSAPVSGSPLTLSVGTGTETAAVKGRLYAWGGATGNAANTDEQTIVSYALPANTLTANGDGIRVTAIVQAAANGNNKTFKIKWGSNTPFASNTLVVAPNNVTLAGTVTILRTGAATQAWLAYGGSSAGTHGPSINTAGVQDLTAAVTIAITLQSPAAGTANDLVLHAVLIEAV